MKRGPKKDEKCATCGLRRSEHTQPIGENCGAIIYVDQCADPPWKKGLIRVVMCQRFKRKKK